MPRVSPSTQFGGNQDYVQFFFFFKEDLFSEMPRTHANIFMNIFIILYYIILYYIKKKIIIYIYIYIYIYYIKYIMSCRQGIPKKTRSKKKKHKQNQIVEHAERGRVVCRDVRSDRHLHRSVASVRTKLLAQARSSNANLASATRRSERNKPTARNA